MYGAYWSLDHVTWINTQKLLPCIQWQRGDGKAVWLLKVSFRAQGRALESALVCSGWAHQFYHGKRKVILPARMYLWPCWAFWEIFPLEFHRNIRLHAKVLLLCWSVSLQKTWIEVEVPWRVRCMSGFNSVRHYLLFGYVKTWLWSPGCNEWLTCTC